MSDINQGEVLERLSDELGVEAETQVDEAFRSNSRERLPFAFAHRFGLVLAKDEQGVLGLYYTDKTPLAALLEVRRYAGEADRKSVV